MMFEQRTKEKIDPLLVTVEGAAKMLAVCPRTVYNMTARGDLPCIHIGTAVRYAVDDIHAFIARASGKISQIDKERSCNKCKHDVNSQV
jgi:excisionase family DNA binding protein